MLQSLGQAVGTAPLQKEYWFEGYKLLGVYRNSPLCFVCTLVWLKQFDFMCSLLNKFESDWCPVCLFAPCF